MKPFKRVMILEYEPTLTIGIYGDRVTTYPWTLKVRIQSWWGLGDKTVSLQVEVPFDSDPWTFYKERQNKWI
jgi:hypothetical protein